MSLIRITEIEWALASITTIDEAVGLRDKAESVRVYAKAAKLGISVQNDAARIRIMSERLAGDLLSKMELKSGPKVIGDTMSPINSLESLGIDKKQSSRWQQEAKLPAEEFKKLVDDCNSKEIELTSVLVRKKVGGAHVGNNAGENEWYTPEDIVTRARSVMGSIDLDPASCAAANKVIGANKFITEEQDGLSKKWSGSVWMNPPYSQPAIGLFIEKLVSEKTVTQACVLINNATETKWFQCLALASSMISFPASRIRFWHPDRKSAPLQGQAVCYIGTNCDEFAVQFSPLGLVVKVSK